MNRAVPLGLGFSLPALGSAFAQGDQPYWTEAAAVLPAHLSVSLRLGAVFALTAVLLVYI